MAVTIKDIAKKAGVSRGTVDRALHGRPGVNPDVAKEILKTAEELGFSPNRAGKMLATKKNLFKVCCIYPGIGNPFFDNVKKGFEDASKELKDFGVKIDFKSVRAYHTQEHIDAVKELLNASYNAICLSTIDDPKIREYVATLSRNKTPVVTVNNDLTLSDRLFYVGCNYYKVGEVAAGLFSLLKLDMLNVLLVSGTRNMKNHDKRLLGFKNTLDDLSLPYTIVSHIETTEDEDYAFGETKRILDKHPEINCAYMISAGVDGVCKALFDSQKYKKIYTITFDDVPTIVKYINNNVIDYTICQEPWLQGYKSLHMLFDYFITNKQIVPDDYITRMLIKIKQNIN